MRRLDAFFKCWRSRENAEFVSAKRSTPEALVGGSGRRASRRVDEAYAPSS